MDVNHHSLSVDVSDLEVNRFSDSQPQRVGGPDEGLHAERLAGVDDLEDLLLRNDFGKCLGVFELGSLKDIPVPGTGVSKEELNAAEEYRLSAGSNFLYGDFVEQEFPHVRFGKLFWRTFTEFAELSDGSNVAKNGTIGLSGELQVFDELAEKFSFEELRLAWYIGFGGHVVPLFVQTKKKTSCFTSFTISNQREAAPRSGFLVCLAKLANPVGACHRPRPVHGEGNPIRKGVTGQR